MKINSAIKKLARERANRENRMIGIYVDPDKVIRFYPLTDKKPLDASPPYGSVCVYQVVPEGSIHEETELEAPWQV